MQGVLVGHVTVITQRQFQQIVEFLVPSVQFLDRVVDFPVACRSCFAHCTTDRGDLTVTILGMVVDAPVVVQRQVP